MHKTILRPTVLHSCETWILKKKSRENLRGGRGEKDLKENPKGKENGRWLCKEK